MIRIMTDERLNQSLEDAAKAKRDRDNLRRRERRSGQGVQQLRIDAKAAAQAIVEAANDKAALLLEDAFGEAASLLVRAREEAVLLKEGVRMEVSDEIAGLELAIRELEATNKNLEFNLRASAEGTLAGEFSGLGTDSVASAEGTLAGEFSRLGTDSVTRASARSRQVKCRSRKRQLRAEMIQIEEIGEGSEIPNRSNRSQVRVVTSLLESFIELVKGHNFASRKAILERFWAHKGMAALHPTFFGCPKVDLSWKTAALDMKQVLERVKRACRKDHKAAKDIILGSLAGKEIVGKRYQSALAKALNVKRGALSAASKTRLLLDGDESLRFPLGQRKERSDRLSEQIRGDIALIWETRTRPSSNKKDNARKRIGPKEYEEHRFHWLEDTEAEYFFKFQEWLKAENKPYNIGLRSFQALKPYFVRTLKDRNVCCCKQHVETQLLCKAFYRQRQMLHPLHCNCSCAVCCPKLNVTEAEAGAPDATEAGAPGAAEAAAPDAVEAGASDAAANREVSCKAQKCVLSSLRQWCASTLCKKSADEPFYKRDCLVGVCEDCGPGLLELCPWEERTDPEAIVTWETYEYVKLDDLPKPRQAKKKTQNSNADEQASKPKKRLRLVSKTTSMHEFMTKISSTLEVFIRHDFYARWQGDQYQHCLKTFPKGTIVSSIDFSENYTFAVQDEVQSLHWDNRQITILVLITYRHQHDDEAHDPIVYDSSGHRITRFIEADYHFFISDDNSHDSFFVQHCLDFHWTWMRQEGFLVNNHVMWSDGCAAQFKACRPFSYVAKYYHTYGARMMWCFHASGHGKGVQDGLGGGVKSALRKEQLRTSGGHPMDGAKDAVEFLKQRFCLGKAMEYDKQQGCRQFFWEVGIRDVHRNQSSECLPIRGVRQMHCFMGYSKDNPILLKCRELACFCDECVLDADSGAKCANKSHALPWSVDCVYPLQPSEVAKIINDMGHGIDADSADCEGFLGDLVSVGDYFVVRAEEGNQWNAEFYILMCTEKAHALTEDFTDAYAAEFKKGDTVLAGQWYQQYGKFATCFVRNDKASLSYVDVSSVVHAKFGLIPTKLVRGSPGFKLSSDTLEAILGSTERANPSVMEMNLYG